MTTLKSCPMEGCEREPKRTGDYGAFSTGCSSSDHAMIVFGTTREEADAKWNALPRAEDAERAFEAGRSGVHVQGGGKPDGWVFHYDAYAAYLASKGTKGETENEFT